MCLNKTSRSHEGEEEGEALRVEDTLAIPWDTATASLITTAAMVRVLLLLVATAVPTALYPGILPLPSLCPLPPSSFFSSYLLKKKYSGVIGDGRMRALGRRSSVDVEDSSALEPLLTHSQPPEVPLLFLLPPSSPFSFYPFSFNTSPGPSPSWSWPESSRRP